MNDENLTPDEYMRHSLSEMASDQVRRRVNDTMKANASRDNLRYARVLGSGESCGFCLMLASRGFVYKSAESAGEGTHYHRSCRCKVVPGFEGMEVDGYDIGGMYDRYNKCLDTIGGRDGIRKDWDALPKEERARRITACNGKEGEAFDKYLSSRVSAEIETRDADWFKSGKIPEPHYQSKRAEHELKTVEKKTRNCLTSNGFAQYFPERSNVEGTKTCDVLLGEKSAKADFKTPRGLGFNCFDGLARDAGHKADILIFHLVDGVSSMSAKDAVEYFAQCGKRRGLKEMILIDYDGSLTRHKT